MSGTQRAGRNEGSARAPVEYQIRRHLRQRIAAALVEDWRVMERRGYPDETIGMVVEKVEKSLCWMVPQEPRDRKAEPT